MQNEFKKTTVPIKGMHCKSCEILIEKNLRKIEGVHNVKSSFKQGKAEITHTDDVYEDQIAQAIKDAGYTIGIEKLNWFSQKSKVYKDILIASAGIMALYFFLQAAGVFNFAPDMSGSVGLMTPLLVGLVAGFSTCMALVGGLVLGISARYSELHPDYTSAQKFTPHLMFNLGRVLGFALLGGLIGAVFKVSPAVLAFLTVAVGLVMLLMGVKLTELFPKLNSISLTLPVSLAKALGINKEHGSNKLAFLSGVLTFFLPCGFTQAMQLYAISTGNFAMGAMVMGLFALGTTPGLLSIGGLSSFMKGQAAKMFFKMAGIVVVLLGIFNIQNGWYVLANSFGAAPSTIAVAEGEQVITMTESSYGYEPNDFTLKQNVPVKWIINARDVYSCASTVIIPKLGVSAAFNLPAPASVAMATTISTPVVPAAVPTLETPAPAPVTTSPPPEVKVSTTPLNLADLSTSTWDDPFAYCAAIGTVDGPDRRYAGPPSTPAIGACFGIARSPSIACPNHGTRWKKRLSQ